ncbi:MAG: diguanylate cyclase [Gammaproteobacteria bacterium]|jgi:diguanylate cyclase (GGDEF)-like protein
MGDVSRAGEQLDRDGAGKFTVYADFNCPFCYALSERMHAMDIEQQVDFRCIEHAPATRSEDTGFDALSKLVGEVAELRRRAPSIQINIPLFRPNTAAASALANAVGLADREQAARLRRRIFRALWIDGEDISNPDFLAALLADLEIEPPDSEPGLSAEWQREWESNPEFDRAIPVVISDRDETLVGFPLEPELDLFLETGSVVSERIRPQGVQPGERQRILMLDRDVHSLRMLIEQVPEAEIEVVMDFPGLVASAVNHGAPDLVLVDTALLGGIDNVDWWRDSADADVDSSLPVIFVSDDDSSEAEVAAFEAGAADFLARPLHPRVFRARIKTHLRARHNQQQLKNIARIDALTSVCNRREFDLRLISEWGRGARSEHSLALLMIDVDLFKQYNDHYGHLRGDDCLVKVAQILSGCVQRAGDLIARYGGEEFVLLLPDVDLDGATRVAESCVRSILDAHIPHDWSTVSPWVTVSIGVAATQPIYEKSCTLLVEQADIALYQAKQDGRNRVHRFEEEV